MLYNELSDREKEIWDEATDLAYDEGWDAGFEASQEEQQDLAYDYSENYDAGYNDGYDAGVVAEQGRVQYILNMMFESALNMGQGNKAIQYKHAMDLLKPPTEMLPYTDED